MRIELSEWQKIRHELPINSSVGFVPTMGCLHQGHASLLQKSLLENKITVLSIFVNPTQFNDPADFQHYPQTLSADLELAEKLGVNYVITPTVTEMYPAGNLISLNTDHPFSKIMEGAHRPGHFNGVLTVVMKLLQLTQPTRIYFGEKDYQQYFLIKELIKNYFINTEIVLCPTVREESGLPYSSRNQRLTQQERSLVEKFYQFFYGKDFLTLLDIENKLIELGFAVNYLEKHDERLFLAFKVGKIRIIDNIRSPHPAPLPEKI